MGARCPSENTILELGGGTLSETRGSGVREHIASCETCASLVELLYGSWPQDEGQEPRATHTPQAIRPAKRPSANPSDGDDRPAADAGAHGARVGRYELLQFLGAGSMGAVYKARDPTLGRVVAIKLLLPRHGAGDRRELSARMLREARAMARLRHPNVVAVYDVGAIDDCAFIAMEYVLGRTLSAWRVEGRRSQREILSAFTAAGRGLGAAHDAGLVHRDFKPDNVLVGDTGEVRVTDFGLARSVEDTTWSIASSSQGAGSDGFDLTRSGTLVGTPAYMAPEQMRREPATARSDVFSFCAALYEALHGVRPFGGSTFHELQDNILSGRVRAGTARVPARLRRALARGLRARETERFASMNELLREIDEATRPKGRPMAAAVGIGVTLTLAAVVWRAQARRPAVVDVAPDPSYVANPTGEDRVSAEWTAPLASNLPAAPDVAPPPARVPPPQQAAQRPAARRAAGVLPSSASVKVGDPESLAPESAATSRVPTVNAVAVPVATGPASEASRATEAPPPASARPGCDPDYWFDKMGNKHFKRECFLNP